VGLTPVETVPTSNVYRDNCFEESECQHLDDLLQELRDSLFRVKPPDPLLFLLHLLQHKVDLRQDCDMKRDSLLYSPGNSYSAEHSTEHIQVQSIEQLPHLLLDVEGGEVGSCVSEKKNYGRKDHIRSNSG